MRKSFEAPTLESLGTITALTGTGGWGGGHKDKCIDLGWKDDKDLGYPSDTFLKIIPICDPENGGVS